MYELSYLKLCKINHSQPQLNLSKLSNSIKEYGQVQGVIKSIGKHVNNETYWIIKYSLHKWEAFNQLQQQKNKNKNPTSVYF